MSHLVSGNLDSYERQLERLLDWELIEFTVGNTSRIADSTSPAQTPHGSSKRPKSRRDADSLLSKASGTLPPQTTTPITGTHRTAKEPKRHATRRTKIFDRHLREDLILRRTTVLPSMPHDLAIFCEGLLESKPTQPWDHVRCEFADDGRAVLHDSREASEYFSGEGIVKSVYQYRQNAAVYLFSTAVSADGVWPYPSGRGRGILHLYTEPDVDQTKALPDASLYVDERYLSSPDSNVSPDMANGLKQVMEQDFSPLAAWEFKDITCATLPVMIAIRDLCSSKDVYQWLSCGEKGRENCPARGCLDPQTGKWRISGRCAKFDSPLMEKFLCRAAGRNVALADYPDSIKPSITDRRTALWIIQQLWAELVAIEATVGVLNGGNYEMLFIRHRGTQSLFTSDILYTPKNRLDPNQLSRNICNPSHIRLHTGLLSLITLDGIQRAKLSKAAKGVDQSLLPSRMCHPEQFNLSPWRGGFDIDTKTSAKHRNGSKAKGHAWVQSKVVFRRRVMNCRRVRLRLRGDTASPYSQFTLEQPGNALHLQNEAVPRQHGNTFVDTSPSDNIIVVLPHHNRGKHTGTYACNLGVGLENDDYYRGPFLGVVASNADDVQRLTHQHRVHMYLERHGNVQRHMGLFVNEDRRFGILFLELIDHKRYWPLSDPALEHEGLDAGTIGKIEAYFNRGTFAHRSLSSGSIFVRRSDSRPEDALFYITEWQHAKIWEEGTSLSSEERDEKDYEQANDKKMLKTILDAVRR